MSEGKKESEREITQSPDNLVHSLTYLLDISNKYTASNYLRFYLKH